MKIKAIAAVAALLVAGAANANVLVNGNFESGSTGWNASGNAGVTHGGFGGFYFGAGSAAQNGSGALVFNSGDSAPNGSFSQTFATTAGSTYLLNFDFGTTVGGSQNLLASILGANGTSVLGNLTVSDDQSTNLLTNFGFSFTADGAVATLRFSDIATNQTVSLDALVDNVTIAAATVPEPASIALLGLGAFALLRSRRKA